MHWFDVTEEYFNAYRDNMDPFFKSPDGTIFTYDEVRPTCVYKTPYYTDEDTRKVGPDARKFLMASNKDYEVVKKQVQSLKRTLTTVSFIPLN